MKRRGFFRSVAAAAAGVVVGSRARAEQTVVTHLKLDTTEFEKQLKALSKQLEDTKAAFAQTCGTNSDATNHIINVVAENIQQRGVLFQEIRGRGA